MKQEFDEDLFNDNEKCLEFISNIKWRDGFICRKCGNTNYCSGKTPHSRRCTRCKSEESAICNTIFQNCRFDISKAFYIAYTVCNENSSISTYEFAKKLSLRQMTCWKFRDKILKAIADIGESPSNWTDILNLQAPSE